MSRKYSTRIDFIRVMTERWQEKPGGFGQYENENGCTWFKPL